MDRWRFTSGGDHIIISRAYTLCGEVEETPRKSRRLAGDALVVGFQAGVFRTFTIIRIDRHVSTDALRRLKPSGSWELDVHLDRVTTWLVFEDVVKAAAAWLGLRAGGALPAIASSSKRTIVTLGPFEPRIVTSTLIQSGAFHVAHEARRDDIAMLEATGIPVDREPMDDHTRERLWVVDHFPPASDAETRAAERLLARGLDTLERESADPDARERCQLMREALERDNNTRRNR
jgi:hypothetical protein